MLELGIVAQLGLERRPVTAKVAGSSPVGPAEETHFWVTKNVFLVSPHPVSDSLLHNTIGRVAGTLPQIYLPRTEERTHYVEIYKREF